MDATFDWHLKMTQNGYTLEMCVHPSLHVGNGNQQPMEVKYESSHGNIFVDISGTTKQLAFSRWPAWVVTLKETESSVPNSQLQTEWWFYVDGNVMKRSKRVSMS